ncbi:glycosyltransferase [Streptomyces axinellae]|uniref:D-inositol 3-phosphate glycosyltransferase n=1 Tax=Streptomyces axinellae TaxID=552788 RepID=A0ABN3QV86_9ACTN
MANSVTRPRLAVISSGGLGGDSRAEKAAAAAARAGWDVTVVARSASTRRETHSGDGFTVIRVPVAADMQERSRTRRATPRGPRARLAHWGLPDDRALASARSAHAAWVRERTALVGWLGDTSANPAARVRAQALKGWVRLRRQAHQSRVKLYRRERARRAEEAPGPVGDWRADWPALLDWDLAFGPVIEEVGPDVIHAAGVTAIAVGARSAARLRARGLRTAWLYDAHEDVAGTRWPDRARASACPAVEAEFIGRADAVTATSGGLARLLQERHGLPRTPVIVGQAPVAEAARAARADRGGPSVRAACELEPGVPLLVHTGRIAPDRGLATAVEALAELPGAHLALVVDGERGPELRAVLDSAARAGVRERVHVLPYVPQSQVAGYLATADLGLVCREVTPDAEVALPAKVGEYLHAGLPMVSTGVRAVQLLVHGYGVGALCAAGDARALAEAVRGVLEQREVLTRNISAALLEELSWERQSPRLLRLYATLAGAAPAPAAEPGSAALDGERRAVADGERRAGVGEEGRAGREGERRAGVGEEGRAGREGQGRAGVAGEGRLVLVPRELPWPGTSRRERPREPDPEAALSVPDWRPVPPQGRPGQPRVRLGLGCANYAGQLSGFARAVCRARPDVAAEVTAHTTAGPLSGYPADVRIPRGQLGGREVKLDRVNRVLGSYTHYLADAFTPAFGWLNGQHIEDDLPALRGAGIEVALLAHGSDVRDPERHMERYAQSLFHTAPEDVLAVLIRNSARNRRVAAESGLPLFVTTPDLLDDLPGASWAPLVVNVEGWAGGDGCAGRSGERPVMERARPVVVHAPSRRWTKGTERVMPVLEELDRSGAIDFRLTEGLPWPAMRKLVKEADIVIDQFAIGTYGTFACEGMAAGKPVVAFLDERVHKEVGAVPPLVNATPDTLRTALESLLDDRAFAVRTGEESRAYVRTYHDGRYTAGVLDGFLS